VRDATDKAEIVARALQQRVSDRPEGRAPMMADVALGLARDWAHFADAQLRAGRPGAARVASLKSLHSCPTLPLGWPVLATSVLRTLVPVRPPVR